MIFYATKKTLDSYNLKTWEELDGEYKSAAKEIVKKEADIPLLQWGAKLFYFDKRESIVLMNYASKFTVFLIDINEKEASDIGNYLFTF